MSCSKDEYCRVIANDYGKKIVDLQDEYNGIKDVVKNIKDDFKTLVIPEDYIGKIVKEKIRKINLKLEDDVDNINMSEMKIENFAHSMQQEHQNHYNEWLIEEEKQKEENNE